MSAIRYGEGCTPGGQPMFAGLVTPEPDHSCSGGYTRPGVLGGWTCPCECHRAASQTSANVDVEPAPSLPAPSAQQDTARSDLATSAPDSAADVASTTP